MRLHCVCSAIIFGCIFTYAKTSLSGAPCGHNTTCRWPNHQSYEPPVEPLIDPPLFSSKAEGLPDAKSKTSLRLGQRLIRRIRRDAEATAGGPPTERRFPRTHKQTRVVPTYSGVVPALPPLPLPGVA